MGDEAFDLKPKGLTSAAAIHEAGAQASRALGETQLYLVAIRWQVSRLLSTPELSLQVREGQTSVRVTKQRHRLPKQLQQAA